MPQKLEYLRETPSQTAGPYVHIGCLPAYAGLKDIYETQIGVSPVRDGAKGEAITISGKVRDSNGTVLRDIMLESWQADAQGIYPGQDGADPNVSGFCRFAADLETGDFTLSTIKPGRNGGQAPHIGLLITSRGLNNGLQTRIYFEDEDNDGDPVLARIVPPSRVATLLARKTGEGSYTFDIYLHGDNETVFLDM